MYKLLVECFEENINNSIWHGGGGGGIKIWKNKINITWSHIPYGNYGDDWRLKPYPIC